MNLPLLDPARRRAFDALAESARTGLPSATAFERGVTTLCSSDRVVLAGGQLASYVTPSAIVPFEMLWRRLPEDGIFTADPSNPCQFEMGSFQVPVSMGLVLLDYRFDIYRPSGSASGDFVPLEDNRLPTNVGWNIKSNANIQGNVRFELNPQPPSSSMPAYQPQPNPGLIPGGPGAPATDAQFDRARYAQAMAASGDLSLMPQRHHRQGLLRVPAPWTLHSNTSLTLSCHIFRAVPIPIAFFEAEVFGFLMPDNDIIALEQAIAPCVTVNGGV